MTLRDRGRRHDAFFRRARAEGYAARAVYKLEEIDRRLGLLRAGMRVLDLGCRPGSWLQYARRRVGPAGAVVGVDRQDLPSPVAGARVVVGDVFAVADHVLLGDLPSFDVVLSDLAPDTTGVRATDQARSAALVGEALLRAQRLLAPGGTFLAKIFQGPDVEPLRERLERSFRIVKLVKPKGSRAESAEMYLVATGFARGRTP